MEEQTGQQDNPHLNDFKISGTGETLLHFNNLLRVQFKNDNVQGFDTEWDEALHSMTKVPDEEIFGNSCKNQLHSSEELKPLMTLYLHDTVQSGQIERKDPPSC